MQLIPKNSDLGWTPYAWLVYLIFFWCGPIFSPHTTAQDWAITALGTAVFLPLYFWGYWLPGRRALIPTGLIALLGIVYAPINFGASVFFVYASAYLGYAVPPATAFRLLLVIAALPPLQAWLMDLPLWFWIPGTVFSLLVGGINIHYANVRRSQAALRRSQDEIERLAKLAERERIAPERATREIAEVEEVAREALKEVRSAVTGFRQTDFSTELAQARVALQSAMIHFESQIDDIALDEASEQVLSLALREATTNVLRHSGAKTCRVRLENLSDRVRLTVQDNGKGGETQDGFGLAGMRERVTALGGEFKIQSKAGVTIMLTLPVAQSEVADAKAATLCDPGPAPPLLPSDPEPSGAK
jgi:two-component system sensor histidine kinase DesK